VSDVAAIAEGREALSRLRRVGQTSWEDWLLVAHALAAGREQAMKTAQTNRPYGPNYYRAMRHWIDANGFGDLTQSERYSCHRLLENLAAITAWRDSLDENHRLKNNHPHGVFWSWRRSLGLAPPLKKLPSAKKPNGRASHADHHSRPIFWPQDSLRRAHQAMLDCRSNDLLKLARVALEAAVRSEADLFALLDAHPKMVHRIRKPKARQIAAPAAIELSA
jgi:hypothetical protein